MKKRFFYIFYFLSTNYCYAHNPSGNYEVGKMILLTPAISLIIPTVFIILLVIKNHYSPKKLLSYFYKSWGFGVGFTYLSTLFFLIDAQTRYEAYHYYAVSFILLIVSGNAISIYNIYDEHLRKQESLNDGFINSKTYLVKSGPKLLYVILFYVGLVNIIDIAIDILVNSFTYYSINFIPILIVIIQLTIGVLCIYSAFKIWFQMEESVPKVQKLILVYVLLNIINAALRAFFDIEPEMGLIHRIELQITNKIPTLIFAFSFYLLLNKYKRSRKY